MKADPLLPYHWVKRIEEATAFENETKAQAYKRYTNDAAGIIEGKDQQFYVVKVGAE